MNINTIIKSIGKYDLQTIIGKGSFAIVYKGQNRETKEVFAIKEVLLDQLEPSNPETQKLLQFFHQEVDILKSLDHPNIIKLYEVINTQSKIYMIFDYCIHGDLEKYLKKNNNKLSEIEAKPMIIQILKAIKLLNSKNIVHRDIKLANVLITQNFEIKLADFGFAKFKNERELFESFCGTPITMAPEILSKQEFYDDKCDIWSLGVIIYQIIYGKAPFYPMRANIQDLIDLINKGHLIFPSNTQISNDLKDLLKKMLVNDPRKRISFKELFEHKWIEHEGNLEEQTQNLLKSIFKPAQVQQPEVLIPIDPRIVSNDIDEIASAITNSINFKFNKFNQCINNIIQIKQSDDAIITNAEGL